MSEFTELEKKLIDYFKRDYMSEALDKASDEIYWLVVEHKFGKGARDPTISIDWDKLFNQNQCPSCDGLIKLEKNQYVCGKCALTMPTTLYDEAERQNKRRTLLEQEDEQLSDEVKKQGIKSRRINDLYKIAEDEAFEEIEKSEKKEEYEQK